MSWDQKRLIAFPFYLKSFQGLNPRKWNYIVLIVAARAAASRYSLNSRKLSENILCEHEFELNLSLQSSHLALIDTLMMAYTVEMVSVERVMSCIGRYASTDPSRGEGHLQDLPYDTEDAIVTWINKVHTGALLCRTTRATPTNVLEPLTNWEHTRLCFGPERWTGRFNVFIDTFVRIK